MNLIKRKIEGCYELNPYIFDDSRGRFVKTFNVDEFKRSNLETVFEEEYYSVSKKNVVRGLHFQLPPFEHVKLVYCAYGKVFDVLVDLRVNSPTYGLFESFELCADKANGIYIPKGVAHGFCTLSDEAILIYNVSTVYSPEFDSGILWSSVDVDWPTSSPLVSERDTRFAPLNMFESPFLYDQLYKI
jgi:dTDP-4-dehydrorhamnose 3,5-epimerase